MGLRAALANIAQAAVAATGDIAVSTNYESFVTTVANVTAGTDTTTYGTTAGVKVIFQNFRQVEIDGTNIRPDDRVALIPSASLTSAPVVSDRLVTDTSIAWAVQGVRTDPAEALWRLHVRR